VPKRSPAAATEIQQYDREAKTLEMRAQGHSFASIAETVGYSDASGASKAYHRALARKPAQNVDQIRAQEAERLEYLWRKAADLIEHPKLAHSAIGKTIPDPREPGEWLIDQSAQIQAMREYRLQSESYRKMCGADIGTSVNLKVSTEDEASIREAVAYVRRLQDQVRELEAENQDLRGQVAALNLAVPAELVGPDPALDGAESHGRALWDGHAGSVPASR
jgi:AraC-like DNA-binding protein